MGQSLGQVILHFIHIYIFFISTFNTQHMQGPDVLLQLGYTWRHVSALKRPSSDQHGVILLRYSQIVFQWDPIVYIET